MKLALFREALGQPGVSFQMRVPGQRRLEPVRVDEQDRLLAKRCERHRCPESDRAHALAEQGAREAHRPVARGVDPAGESIEHPGDRVPRAHQSGALRGAASKAIAASLARRS